MQFQEEAHFSCDWAKVPSDERSVMVKV